MTTRRYSLISASLAALAAPLWAQQPPPTIPIQFPRWYSGAYPGVPNQRPNLPLVLTTSPTLSTRTVLMGDLDLDGDLELVGLDNGVHLYVNGAFGGGVSTVPSPSFGVFEDASYFPNGNSRADPSILDLVGGVLIDVDNDGDLDVVSTSLGRQGPVVYLNTVIPSGLLQLPLATSSGWTIPTPFTVLPTSIAAGDLDGDNDLDLVAGTWDGLYVFMNDPAGLQFTDVSGVTVRFAGSPFAGGAVRIEDVAVGDIDGDGDQDIACAFSGALPNIVALNPGGLNAPFTAGAILTPTPFPTGAPLNTGRGIAMGDLDGNGALDVVVVNDMQFQPPSGPWLGAADAVYLNPGGLAVVAPVPLPTSTSFSRDVALADFDEDGDLDIVVANDDLALPNLSGQTHLYLNDGAATFVDVTAMRVGNDGNTSTHTLAVGDIDFDLDLDIFQGNESAVRPFHFLPNHLQQLDAPRSVGPSAPAPWTIAYDMLVDPGFGMGGAAFLAVTLTQPVHLFPPGPLGFVASAPWTTAGIFVMPMTPPNGFFRFTWTIPFNPAFVGTTIWAQALITSNATGRSRLSNVIRTTIQ